MAFVLKLNYDGDIRRKRFESQADLTFDKVKDFVNDSFSLGEFVAKYRDDEDDLCTLKAETLPDALEHVSAKNVLHLSIFLPKKSEATADTKHDDLKTDSSAGQHNFSWTGCATEAEAGQQHWSEHGSDGWHKGGVAWHGGGPKWIIFALKMMSQAGCLRADYATAVIVQWLPIIKQRAIRKMEKIRAIGAIHVSKFASALVALSEAADLSQNLQPFKERLCSLVTDPEGVDIGMLVADFLQALVAEPFAIQCKVVEPCISELINSPFVQEKLSKHVAPEFPSWTHSLLHHGVACDGCQQQPIEGPRFKSTMRPDYDLCAQCYLKKDTLLDADHVFETIFLPGKGDHGWKGCKGKHFKGWHHPWAKGFGKGMGHGWWHHHMEEGPVQDNADAEVDSGKGWSHGMWGKGKGKGKCKGKWWW